MDDKSSPTELAPAIIVIFGVTGDLASRKLLPALFELEKNGLLHPKTTILGISRHDSSKDQLLEKSIKYMGSDNKAIDQEILKRLTKRLEVFKMAAADASEYPRLAKYLNDIEGRAGICMHMLFYLAIPPQISGPIIKNLGVNGMDIGCTQHQALSHLLLEKPFGFDTKTAEELIEDSRKYFREEQLFYIDHYLAKETVQNLVTFRFRNPIFEDIWGNQNIESIEIVADEKLDIEGRANFYEQVGAMRDLVQSHLLHILSLMLMDRPDDITDPKAIHANRLAALKQIEPVPSNLINERVLRAQYSGYKNEVDKPDSSVETFVAIKLFSVNPQWANVPIYIRSGKALKSKQTYIKIKFRPKNLDYEHANELTFYIQPQESIQICLWVKKPGFDRVLQIAPMQFSYKQSFSDKNHPDAYERVLVDAIRGDNTLFAISEEILAAWRILQPILDHWSNHDDDLVSYSKGSLGPDLEDFYS